MFYRRSYQRFYPARDQNPNEIGSYKVSPNEWWTPIKQKYGSPKLNEKPYNLNLIPETLVRYSSIYVYEIDYRSQ